MRLFLIVFSLLACALGSAAMAGPADDKVAQREGEPYRGYAKACGYPIIFQNITTISQARIDARLGPVIILDPLLLYPSQGAHRRFMVAHECAHHRFKHTTKAGLTARRTANKGVEDQELSADCWAAEALAEAGRYNDVRFIVDLFYRQGLESPGSGYPSGVQRSAMIYHCMKTAHRKQVSAKDSAN